MVGEGGLKKGKQRLGEELRQVVKLHWHAYLVEVEGIQLIQPNGTARQGEETARPLPVVLPKEPWKFVLHSIPSCRAVPSRLVSFRFVLFRLVGFVSSTLFRFPPFVSLAHW